MKVNSNQLGEVQIAGNVSRQVYFNCYYKFEINK